MFTENVKLDENRDTVNILNCITLLFSSVVPNNVFFRKPVLKVRNAYSLPIKAN